MRLKRMKKDFERIKARLALRAEAQSRQTRLNSVAALLILIIYFSLAIPAWFLNHCFRISDRLCYGTALFVALAAAPICAVKLVRKNFKDK